MFYIIFINIIYVIYIYVKYKNICKIQFDRYESNI